MLPPYPNRNLDNIILFFIYRFYRITHTSAFPTYSIQLALHFRHVIRKMSLLKVLGTRESGC